MFAKQNFLVGFGNKKKLKDAEINFDKLSSLAELMVTRFTHDISGPVSAIANGLDFVLNDAKDTKIKEGLEVKNQAINLIEESSLQALARVQVYRMAYGVIYSKDATCPMSEVTKILNDFFYKSQVKINWGATVPSHVTCLERRMCVAMMIIMGRVLIYGGKINVTFAKEGDGFIELKGKCNRFKNPQLIKDILDEKDSDIEADVENVPYFFIREIAKQDNIKLIFEFDDEDEKDKKVSFKAVFKQRNI